MTTIFKLFIVALVATACSVGGDPLTKKQTKQDHSFDPEVREGQTIIVTVTGSSTIEVGGGAVGTTTLKATVIDKFSAPLEGVAVNLVPPTNGGTISNNPQTSDANGECTFTLVSSAVAGTYKIDAEGVDESFISEGANVTFLAPGFTVSAISGNTTEAGGTATFTVRTITPPTANVTVSLSSSDTTEGTVSPASLVFNSSNYDTPQTVTVTGVNDFVVDGDISYTIVTGAATSGDAKYSGLNPNDVTVTNTDDDIPGATVTAISGNTTEAGGTATFTIKLDTQPANNVSISLSSSDTGEGTVSPASLTFTSGNFNTPQTVTVTGVDDLIDDDDVSFTIVTGATSSVDAAYNGIAVDDVTVTNTDNDTAGITVGAISGATSETGTTATFTIVLATEPTANVTIGLSSSDTSEGTVSPGSVTFTSGNWNTPQTVTATGVNDFIDDGNISYNIVTAAASSSDSKYSGLNAADVAVTNNDDADTAGITVGAISGNTTEAGGTATFTVVLDSEPTANVTIGLTSSNTAEGTVSPASLSFTSGNWNTPQTVTVTGVDEMIFDGNQTFNIVTAAAVSVDAGYSGLNAADVSVTNEDDDVPGFNVTAISGNTTEAGGTATFTIRLQTEPTANVTVGITSSDTGEGTVSPASLVFTSGDWNTPQTVTVTGVDDDVDDDDITFNIVTAAATSGDTDYNGLNPDDVSVTNQDDDTAGVTVSTISGNTDEDGTQATFTVVLDSEPTNDVNIGISSDDATEGTASPASLTFTSGNWDTPQTVTVTGQNDVILDGSVSYNILTAAAISGDAKYNTLDADDVAVVNDDNNSATFTMGAISGNTTEAGGTATFTIVMDAQPLADVSVGFSSDDTGEGTVSPASVTFTAGDWNTPQTITITGVDDNLVDGGIAYNIISASATSGDANFNGVDPDDVAVTNDDDDNATFTVGAVSGDTSEAGATATFTVVMDAQPTADVTVGISSDDTSEGTVSPATLTFTNGNWNTPQTVTITGADDFVVDGTIGYNIVTAAASSGDTAFNGVDPDDVALNNTDNDVAGFTVGAISGNTTEAGGTATFTVVLTSEPIANVTVGVSSDNTNEGTVSPATLTFTSGDWNTPQTVTVTGVDDAVVDGGTAYNIVLAAATSGDTNYNTLNPNDVGVINQDDDVAGINVSAISGNTTEAGGTATFTVTLNSEPTANVSIGISSSDTSEGTVAPATLTFTSGDWNTPQTVTVTGVDDDIDDDNVLFTIVTAAATSGDGNYNTLNASDVSVTNEDDDTAGITVGAISGNTTEAGGTATFTVVLDTEPTANVSIGISSSDTGEGTVAPATLTFTSGDWNTPQTVTITGQDDFAVDGDISFTIVTAAATSGDSHYNTLDANDVSVTNEDDDSAGFTVSAISGNTTEAGGTATFTVVLTSLPAADVQVTLASDDASEGTASPGTLTFTSADWNTPQTVTVTGQNDFMVDGGVAYNIVLNAATSGDGNYNGVDPNDVAVTNDDNDTAGFTVSAISGNTTEAGGTATFTIVLTSQPANDVTIGLSSDDTGEGTVSPASVTFTNGNWNTPQTVTVTGVDDDAVDGSVGFNIITAAATSGDANYNTLDPADVSVNNDDDDVAGVTVGAISGATTEAGGTATFTVVLNTQPASDVTIAISSDDTTEGTVAPASLTFTNGNWSTPQTVTVTGVDDDVVDGNIGFNIVTGAASSADADYNTMAVNDVAVTNNDNDTADITVTAISGNTTEAGGTATFTVVLTSEPTANVTVGLTSDDTSEGTVAPASVVFTSGDWNTPQTVTVTGVNDDVVDGDIAFNIVTAAATSIDGNYGGLNPNDVAVTNTDNDTAGITVSAISGNTNETGTTATFTVVLTSEPIANVSIGISSDDTTEGTVAPATLTFTSGDWSTPQTVTVTGADDASVDGNITFNIVTAAASSGDPNYNGVDANDVSVTNDDDDTAGINVSVISGPTTEAGGTATFTVVLASAPASNVTIGISSDNTNEGTVSPATLTFTNGDWSTPQTVTVTGVDDAVQDGNIAYNIVTAAASSGDANYNTLDADDVAVTNNDNDTAGITVGAISGNTNEDGTTATFTIVLDSQPTANVTIGISSDDTTEGTVSPTSVVFTAGDWNTPQTVTVTGVNDELVDGSVGFNVITAAATSGDGNYNTLDANDVAVTNDDDGDTPGATLSAVSGNTTEAGATATFTIVLTAQPSADVTIGLTSSNTAEGTVSPASVTFTNGNWNTPQTVTVTGVDDDIDDGNIVYTIQTAAATSGDGSFNGYDAGDATVTNTDNDTAGITVGAISGNTTEGGGTATFTVVLDSEPTANVIIGVTSDDTGEGTVSPATLTFTSGDWDTPQTVTVTGVDDALDDGNIIFNAVLAAATSGDGNYNGVDAADVAITNEDDDTSTITVGAISGATTEAGGTATFTVVLDSEPTANVTIGISSDNTAEGTVSPATLTFTTGDWSTPQTVTVTGVDDDSDDGNIVFNVITAAASSGDLNFNGVNPSDVAVTNNDDDTAGITLGAVSGPTTEAGGTATFTVVLDTLPTANVSIGLSSSDTGEGTVSPATLTFTTGDWSTPQTVTVTGVDDDVQDGNIAFTIVTAAATSGDGNYNSIDAADASVTNNDDDVAGITVSAISGNTTEAGATATFTVVLDAEPTADVSIGLSSDDTGEGTVSPASLTFTSGNWDTPQTVTVTGVDDDFIDGGVAFNIVTAAASSGDGNYNGVDANDVAVTNDDDDSAGFTLTAITGDTSEAGATASFTIVMDSQPGANVNIAVSSDDTTEGTVSPATITFTSGDWDTPQTITVTGVNDDMVDGTVAYNIVLDPATSGDTDYNGVDPADVAVNNTDNDVAGISVTAISGNTTEAGGTATFTIVLDTQPASNVSIGVSSDDTGEGTVSPATVTFTSGDWNTPQTITVTGVDDDIIDGNVSFNIITAAATSGDSNYNTINANDVSVTNEDNDTAGFTLGAISGATTEAGGTATFTIVMDSQPSLNVSVGISSDDTGEGTVSPATITFTSGDWDTPQTVTVTGVDDDIVDGNVGFNIITAAATSGDTNYNTVNPADVAVTNNDDDVAGITVGAISGATTEAGGTATFTVVLDTQPASNVTIGISSDDTGEGTVSPATLTFTSGDWSTPQTVTVTGVDDDAVDGNVAFNIVTAAASSGDTNYNGIDANDVSVTNNDDDVAGITVGAISGTTDETGATATFTIVLDTQPGANVTIGLSSSDTGEGTVSPASVTFTSGDWNTPQTVTVTGVDDDAVDGNIAFNIVTAAATSGDTNYNTMDASDVSVTNNDDDVAGITVGAISGNTDETGATATFTVVLDTQPSNDVTIGISSDDTGEGTVSPASLTFTNGNWNTPQTVTVTGVDDDVVDGNIAYNIVTAAATSGDTNYNGMNANDVAVTNDDDDVAGITVGAISGNTTEAGGTATFTVVLNTQPANNVTIGVSSDDTGEGQPDTATLTFTSGDWNTPQTVTVTGQDDSLDDGDVAYNIVLAAASSGDTNYNGIDPNDVAVTNTDNDTSGITVGAISGNTTEAGGTATFTVVLDTEPTASVSIGVTSDDTGEGQPDTATLTFTTGNWNTPQTVTVTGQNDNVADGDVSYNIVLAAATGGDYAGIDANDVAVTNTDDDAVGITVGAISGSTSEAGGTATFTVVLDSEPTASVSIGVTSDDTGEGQPDTATLSFTTGNWNTPQTVTVTGQDDDIDDGDIGYNIVLAAATGGDYAGIDANDVAVTNTDDDTAGITVSAISGNTGEDGTTATFTVVLDSEPTSNVSIGISSDNGGEGTADTATLTFTSGDWSTPQTVTVTGQDDSLDDGDIAYNIITDPATSLDGNYGGVNPDDVAVTNVDDDAAGVNIGAISGNTTEAGGTATFSVVLGSQPTADVSFNISSDNTNEGTVSPASLTFTNGNWNTPQTVTVTGVDDDVDDGDIAFNIVTDTTTSGDGNYAGQDPADVAVTNTDDDTKGVTVSAISGNTTEAGGTATFTVVLDSEPTASVSIGVSSDDTGEGQPDTATLTFTTGNWNTPQTVTVTGQDDNIDDGDVAYNIVLAAATGGDYAGIDPGDVAVTNTNDDTAGVTVSAISGNTTEAGATGTFTVVLTSEPTASVTVGISSDDTTEGQPDTASLTFTTGNWNTPQTVTVTGQDDDIDDGDVAYNIVTAAASGGGYDGIDGNDVAITNTDDDTAGITVGAVSGNTTEAGGTATFTVVLDTEPTASVSIGVSSDDTGEGQPDTATLTFTTGNWNTPQTVTITGQDDNVDDGDIAYNIVLAAATGGGYDGIDPGDIATTNIDNDAKGITVGAISGNTGEDGTTATFTVVLDSEPTASVSIGVSSDTPAEGIADTATLTFTTGNWNTPQTVTITGQDDFVDDGDIAYNIVLAAATGGDYAGIDPGDVAVTNVDDDTLGITVGGVSGNTTEAGGTATFTVVLNTEPTASVSIGVSSDTPAEGTADTATLTFTTGNWSTPQTVTITGQDDNVDDGDIAYNIVLAAATGGDYAGQDPGDVALSNIDDDTKGITVGAISGNTTEAGGTATFTVVLDSEPTASVSIGVTSDDTGEGQPDTATLTFTTGNWNTPQTVTVTGQDDNVDDGDIAYNIVLAAATGGDYAGIDPGDVAVTNTNDDTAGITVGAISGNTTEAGGTATFTVVLDTEPTASVSIGVSSDDTGEGQPDTGTLTFTTGNWNTPQTVTVTGQNDNIDDGDIAYNIVLAAASGGGYDGIDPNDVAATNTDDDTRGVTVGAISGNTTEAGGTATFTVVLDTEPTASVSIGVSSDDTGEGQPDTGTLTFTTGNWNTPQTVTVTGQNDFVVDGDVAYNIVLAAATGGDYAGTDPADVAVTNNDDDVAGVTVGAISGNTTEAGGTATFTVVLDAEPSASVTIGVTSDNTAEGQPDTATLTFTTGNWNTPQTVTVTGQNDDVADGDIGYNIVLATAVGGGYDAVDPNDVAVTNTDDDVVGITVGAISGNTTEAGGTATFTVVLDSEPTASVTIGVSSDNTAEGQPDTALLTFTTADWSTPQTITITGQNDFVDDGDIAYNIVLAAAAGGDYAGQDPADVAVTNVDDDTVGITVGAVSGNTTEAGGTATFTVVLDSEPTAAVSIGVSSDTPAEGQPDTATLNFTTANWNTPQTVTITGQDDFVDDGDIAYNIVLAAATGGDYAGQDPADVAVTNINNDTRGVTVGAISGDTSEDGTTATFTVVLDTQPTASVSIGVSSDTPAEGQPDTATLTFTTANWNTPQTVTVTGQEDAGTVDGDIVYNIVLAAATGGDYAGTDPADVAVTNLDNDTPVLTSITLSVTGDTVIDDNTGTNTSTTIRAIAYDQSSNPMSGVTLSVNIPGGSGLTASAATATDVSGIADFTINSGTKLGPFDLDVSDAGATVTSNTVTITVNEFGTAILEFDVDSCYFDDDGGTTDCISNSTPLTTNDFATFTVTNLSPTFTSDVISFGTSGNKFNVFDDSDCTAGAGTLAPGASCTVVIEYVGGAANPTGIGQSGSVDVITGTGGGKATKDTVILTGDSQ